MADDEKKVENQQEGRSTADVLADIGMGMLRSAANGGRLRNIVAGGILGGLVGDESAEQKKMELENSKLRNQLLKGQILAQKNAAEDREKNNQYRENAEHRAQTQFAYWEKENASQQPVKDAQRRLQLNQLANAEAKALTDKFNIQMKPVLDRLNYEGQSILKTSPGFNLARDMFVAYNMYDTNPEYAKSILSSIGWEVEEKDGEVFLMNSEKKVGLPFNEQTMKMLQEKAGAQFKSAYEASMVMGTPAYSLQHASMRSVLSNKATSLVYGKDNLPQALADYKKLIQTGKFDDEQIATHVLTRTLVAALEDKQITAEEQQALMPLFAAGIKKFGGELQIGNGVDDTYVTIQGGTKIPISTVMKDLQERDVVMARWTEALKNKYQKDFAQGVKLAAAAEKAMIPRPNNNVFKGWGNIGNDKPANPEKKEYSDSGWIGGDWQNKQAAQAYALGEDAIKKYNLSPANSPEEITRLGVAFAHANQAFNSSGFYMDAENAYYDWDRKIGGTLPKVDADGKKMFFLSDKARKADIAKIKRMINSSSGIERKRLEKTLEGLEYAVKKRESPNEAALIEANMMMDKLRVKR